MEANGLGGGLFSAMGSGMLGLEMPLQNHSNVQSQNRLQHPQMVAYVHHDPDHHPQTQPSLKHGFTYGTTPKSKQVAVSDEDEPGIGADHDGTNGDGKRKMSPWQRMKWTEAMVNHLITTVYYVGDEGGSEGNDPAAKKKPIGGLLQKKGKWKTVSRNMMENGYYVSPQQCEDKFNDLNKRYKRVNDILGKGTACKVVENQSLLDSMDLSPKLKEEVRKLLNSKHLFFKEMCAYHNSCAQGIPSGAASGLRHSPELALDRLARFQANQQAHLQRCLDLTEASQVVANLGRQEAEASKMVKTGSAGEDEEEDDEGDDSDEYDDGDEDDEAEGGSRGQVGHGHDQDDDNYERLPSKRPRKEVLLGASPMIQQFSLEILGVVQDGAKSPWEKKQWLKMRLLQLEEQQMNYHYESFELEKQRFKWLKFSSQKEREMEKAKLENERRRLENERMVLLIRQKELEVLDLHHHHQQQQQHSSNKRGGDPSSVTG